jgi:hypothetical protein
MDTTYSGMLCLSASAANTAATNTTPNIIPLLVLGQMTQGYMTQKGSIESPKKIIL